MSASSAVSPVEGNGAMDALTEPGSDPSPSASGKLENEVPAALELDLDPHPLLIDHVVDGIFQYFEGDIANLTSYRLVCKAWNVSAARLVKDSLRWRIGVRSNTLWINAKKDEADLADFQSMMAGLEPSCSSSRVGPSMLFRNVHICKPPTPSVASGYYGAGRTQLHFLEMYGHLILDMKLASDRGAETGGLVLRHTPNLESLCLYEYGHAILMRDMDFCLPKVKKVCVGAQKGLPVDEVGIVRLAKLFPNLQELECRVANDLTLHALYKAMPKLKRLNLGWSQISDIGITWLQQAELNILAAENLTYDGEFTRKVERKLGISLALKPNVGMLADLVHLTVEVGNLSEYSVYLGIVHLKNLEYLKMKGYTSFSSRWIGGPIPVPAAALADSCPKLAKLDVVGSEAKCGTYMLNTIRLNWLQRTGFCGLLPDVLAYVKRKLPNLQLVYDRPGPAALAGLQIRNAWDMAELMLIATGP